MCQPDPLAPAFGHRSALAHRLSGANPLDSPRGALRRGYGGRPRTGSKDGYRSRDCRLAADRPLAIVPQHKHAEDQLGAASRNTGRRRVADYREERPVYFGGAFFAALFLAGAFLAGASSPEPSWQPSSSPAQPSWQQLLRRRSLLAAAFAGSGLLGGSLHRCGLLRGSLLDSGLLGGGLLSGLLAPATRVLNSWPGGTSAA